MPTYLPTDANQNPIPALRLKPSGAQTVSAATGSSARNATAFAADTLIVSLFATQDVYVRFGDNTVTAANTDHFFPANTYYDFAIGDKGMARYTNIAVRAVSTAGTVYISEKE